MKTNKKSLSLGILTLVSILCLFLTAVPALASGGDEENLPATFPTVKEAAVPLSPEGNLSLLDDLIDEEAEDKQFITVQSKSGNVFYIIIDRVGKENNVYFLNLVDEADLMALMEKDGSLDSFNKEAGLPPLAETAPEPTIKPEPEIPTEEHSKGKSPLPILMVIVLLLAGAGLWFFKYKNPKQASQGSTNLDEYFFDDEDDEDYEEEIREDDPAEMEGKDND